MSIFAGGILVDTTSDADIPDEVWSKDTRTSELELQAEFPLNPIPHNRKHRTT